LTIDEMKAAIEEAHKRNKLAEAHATGAEGIKNSIKAGIDSIAHGVFLDEEGAEMMVEREIPLAPTLSILHVIVEHGPGEGIPRFVYEKAKDVVGIWERQFRFMHERGVKIVLGTDGGGPFNLHGNSALELELFVRYGMSEMEAIVAGTKHAAETLAISERVGTLESGKFADLVVLDKDPLKDIRVLRQKENIKMVLKEGEVVASS
jgi:imidazolonepropionase-like amidohydrolase